MLGNQVDNAGIKVINNKQITIEMMNGITAIAIFSNFTPPTLEATNKLTPNGGVTKPKAKFATNITPKCTGSTPTDVTIGKRIGVNTTNAEIVSINIPTKKSNTLIANKITIGFVDMLVKNEAMSFGICSSVM